MLLAFVRLERRRPGRHDPTRLAALFVGGVQGTVLTHPAMNKAESLGFKSLANRSEMGVSFPTNTVTVRRGWLKENRSTAEKFLKDYIGKHPRNEEPARATGT